MTPVYAAVNIDWHAARVIALSAPCGTLDRVVVASSFVARGVGLLARGALLESEGMLFVPGGSMHTFGMRFAIDIVFLDERLEVRSVVANVRPWRMARAPRHTRFVLELRSCVARELGIQCGSTLVPVVQGMRPSSAPGS